MYTTFFDDPARINTEMSRYSAVTADQVRNTFASHVRPDNQVVLTYVPAEDSARTAGATTAKDEAQAAVEQS